MYYYEYMMNKYNDLFFLSNLNNTNILIIILIHSFFIFIFGKSSKKLLATNVLLYEYRNN